MRICRSSTAAAHKCKLPFPKGPGCCQDCIKGTVYLQDSGERANLKENFKASFCAGVKLPIFSRFFSQKCNIDRGREGKSVATSFSKRRISTRSVPMPTSRHETNKMRRLSGQTGRLPCILTGDDGVSKPIPPLLIFQVTDCCFNPAWEKCDGVNFHLSLKSTSDLA